MYLNIQRSLVDNNCFSHKLHFSILSKSIWICFGYKLLTMENTAIRFLHLAIHQKQRAFYIPLRLSEAAYYLHSSDYGLI